MCVIFVNFRLERCQGPELIQECDQLVKIQGLQNFEIPMYHHLVEQLSPLFQSILFRSERK